MSSNVNECKPLVGILFSMTLEYLSRFASGIHGLTLVHYRAQLEQLQDTFMG